MKAIVGVSLELLALIALSAAYLLVPPVIQPLYLVIVQLMATYLVHCPAHYLVGMALGIRFRSISLGRTTLARTLPPRFGKFAALVPIVSLKSDKGSLARVSKTKASTMYLSGTVASSASAVVIATVVTSWGSWTLALACWAVAVGYVAFDVVFSPKSGDVMRARRARGR